MGNIFRVSHIFKLIYSKIVEIVEIVEIRTKYEKRGKYLPILQGATCDNYFIVKFLLKKNVATIILLTY